MTTYNADIDKGNGSVNIPSPQNLSYDCQIGGKVLGEIGESGFSGSSHLRANDEALNVRELWAAANKLLGIKAFEPNVFPDNINDAVNITYLCKVAKNIDTNIGSEPAPSGTYNLRTKNREGNFENLISQNSTRVINTITAHRVLYCIAGCAMSCHGCANSCWNACNTCIGCRAGCQNGCGDSCSGRCQSNCGTGCADGCQTGCKTACSGCTNNCTSECIGGCTNACTGCIGCTDCTSCSSCTGGCRGCNGCSGCTNCNGLTHWW